MCWAGKKKLITTPGDISPKLYSGSFERFDHSASTRIAKFTLGEFEHDRQNL